MTDGSIHKVSVRSGVLPYALVVAVGVVLVYANTLRVPFIFDDQINIVENRSIRDLSSFTRVLAPPFGMGVAGRPVVNLTLALNYAMSGEDTWSYHLLNLLIHLSAALCLFGILRRSFLTERLKGTYGNAATPLAFSCALLWAVHPLQTQAVTYTVQRCESLMALCFLLTFYLAIRGWQSAAARPFHLAAVLAFLVGVGTKEVIVVAPVLLFVYDILFFPGDPQNLKLPADRAWLPDKEAASLQHPSSPPGGRGLRSALRVMKRSRLLYGGLTFGLICLGSLVTAGGTASSGAGSGVHSALEYWVTQPGVILHYLRLTFWPHPLSLDYGWSITGLQDAWLSVLIVATLLGASLWALLKGNPIGYPAAWFFAVLAPTSLIPLPDAAFEHRMYLASIAVVVITATTVFNLLKFLTEEWLDHTASGPLIFRKGSFYLLLLTGLSLAITTYARNLDYRSDVSIWADAVRNHPENSRAHANLGNALIQEGRIRDAVGHLYEALNIEATNAKRYGDHENYYEYLLARPAYAKLQDNLGWAWLQRGDTAAAVGHLEEALKANPDYATALAHMGIARNLQGRYSEAMDFFQRAIKLNPYDPDIRVNLGVTLRLRGKPSEAIRHFQEALRLRPRNVEAYYGIGMALFEQGREAEALTHFERALKLNPDFGPARSIVEKITEKR